MTHLWALAARIGGRVLRSPVDTFRAGGPVLVVSPHPDDETIGCAGTLVRHRANGDAVDVWVATDGRRSRALPVSPEQMAEHRRREATAACRALDVRVHWAGLREGAWDQEELISALSACLREHRPAVIYAPSRVDFHPEHLGVAAALARALVVADISPEIRVFPAQVPLGPALTNLVVDVTDAQPQIAAATTAYASQSWSLASGDRRRRYTAAFYGVGTRAEGFWSMSAATYIAQHATLPTSTPYRSLRGRSWSDPLAYAVGRNAREELAKNVGGVRAREGREAGPRSGRHPESDRPEPREGDAQIPKV